MTEEAPERDTPVEADTPGTDWQKRYSDLQPEYTRATQALKEEQALWDDEAAAIARFQEKFPHLIAEPDEPENDPDLYEEDEDPHARKLTELEKRQQAHDEYITRQLQKEDRETFNSDLSEEAGDRTLSRQAKDWIWNETVGAGGGRGNLKKAVAAWVEYEDGVRAEAKAEYLKTKRGPTPPKPGTAGEEQRNPRDRKARRAAIAASIEAGTQD